MDRTVSVSGDEINAPVIDRIRTALGYGATVEEIVAAVPTTETVTTRWVRFVARMIETGRI